MRLKALVIATALMAYAAPVMAQGVEVHDHSKKRGRGKGTVQVGEISEAKVTGFAPMTGPVGTVVTITGANFLQQTKVKVGGRPVKLLSFTPTALTFAMPGRYFDGVITLHHPGSGNPIPVGTFSVQVDPRIANFNPRSGPIGTRVELNGEGFVNGDQILFNGKPLQLTEFGPNRVVIVIPQGASSDEFVVYRPSTKYQSASKQKFEVSMPAPTVSSLSPTQGAPGTQVRISGTYFGGDDRVFYGPGRPVNIVGRSDSYIDVQVPNNARQSNPFTIKSSRGNVQTPVFVLVMNPTISGFSPEYGGTGTQVDIFGAAFQQSDQVYFNGKPIKRLAFEDNKLKVEIPQGASTDRFVVWRNGQAMATANKPFQVQNAPTISGFSPTQGAGGTKVQISGSGFERDAKVTYGAKQLQVVGRRGDREIHVIVPQNAGNQPFTVTTRGGSVNSATSFQVVDYSTIIAISPDRGPVGTRVTISQQGYSGNDTFWIGNVALPILEKAQGRYVVQIPANAQTGRIEWETYGKRQTSPYVFTVVAAQTIARLEPASVSPGGEVKIHGTGFGGATRVYYGNNALKVTQRNPTRLVAIVPKDATPGKDWIYTEEHGAKVKSPEQLEVVGASVQRFEPASVQPGGDVAVYGTGFGGGTKAYFGNTQLKITQRNPTRIVFQVPKDITPGKDWIYIEEYGQKLKSATQLEIQGANIQRFEPAAALPGAEVKIHGAGFGGATKVYYGNIQLKVTQRNPTRLVAVIPPGTGAGKDWIYIEEYGQKVKAPQQFEVLGAPAPQPSPPPPPPPPPPQASCSFTAAPATAAAGQTITIDTSNCNVKNVKQGWFKGEPVQIVSVNASAVVVRLSAKASGTDHIALETDDGKGVAVRARTSNKITVKGGY